MNLAELLGLIKDKDITVNVQTGDGATQYNGATQINQRAAEQKRAAEPIRGWTYQCGNCGYTSTTRSEFENHRGYDSGYRRDVYLCRKCQRKYEIEQARAERRAAEEAEQRIAESKRLVISAPPEEPEIVIDPNQKRPYYDPNVLRRKWRGEGR